MAARSSADVVQPIVIWGLDSVSDLVMDLDLDLHRGSFRFMGFCFPIFLDFFSFYLICLCTVLRFQLKWNIEPINNNKCTGQRVIHYKQGAIDKGNQ